MFCFIILLHKLNAFMLLFYQVAFKKACHQVLHLTLLSLCTKNEKAFLLPLTQLWYLSLLWNVLAQYTLNLEYNALYSGIILETKSQFLKLSRIFCLSFAISMQNRNQNYVTFLLQKFMSYYSKVRYALIGLSTCNSNKHTVFAFL